MRWLAEVPNPDAGQAPQPVVPLTGALAFVRSQLGFHPDEHQAKIFDPSIRRGLLCCTRQFGKSTSIAALAVHRAFTNPGITVLVIAPRTSQSGEFLYKVEEFLAKLGICRKTDGINKRSRVLPNGSRIVAVADVDTTVRGYSASLVIIDEAARVRDSAIEAIRPTLAVRNGDLWMMSTPAGRQGAFYKEWTGPGKWFRLMVTADQCPRIPAGHLENERASLSERRFLQEYYCEFLGADNVAFDEKLVHAAQIEDTPHAGIAAQQKRYIVGVDLGMMQDHTAIVVLERNDITFHDLDPVTRQRRQITEFTVRHIDRLNLHTPFTEVASRIRGLVNTYPYQNACTLVFDASGLGLPVHEMLKAAHLGCPIVPIVITGADSPSDTHIPKKDLIATVQMMLELRELRIPRNLAGAAWLIQELLAMRVKPTEAGSIRYEAAPGYHDDLVTALSLAAWPTRPRRPHVGEQSKRLL